MSLRAVVAFFAAFLLSAPVAATQVLPLTLDELVGKAAVAFHGTVLANRSEREAGTGVVVTYTTFAVRDVLKGRAGTTYEIKQIGGDPGDGGPVVRFIGVPRFAEGHDYVVFLPPASSAGFSSPVGLGQGRFSVLPGTAGPAVSNGRDLQEMTATIPLAADSPAGLRALRQAAAPVTSMGLAEFKQLVRSRAGGAR